ncbi:MAG: DEAD/DEAH box helicase family protein, partial [Clostridia bacterium]|nr:DEAD/DEAH box helicase family protein [Clostridia bacterium]
MSFSTNADSGAPSFATVRLLDTPFVADKGYSYRIPAHLLGEMRTGMLVRVPFGRGGRVSTGIVTALSMECSVEGLKTILSFCEGEFHLSSEMLALATFLTEHTLCTMGEAIKTILPPGALDSTSTARRERTVYPLLSREELEAICNGVVTLRSAAHRAVLQYFIGDMSSISQSRLCELLSVTPAQIKALVDRHYLAYGTAEVMRNPYASLGLHRDQSPLHLSRAQTGAWETLMSLYHTHTPKAALLFGVTGSGKTKVMMRLMDDVLAEGKQVIMLVPEIALTPQTVSIFCRRYGTRVAVIHSGLSTGE